MCVTCGCSEGAEVSITDVQMDIPTSDVEQVQEHTHVLPDGALISHSHDDHSHSHDRSHKHSHNHNRDRNSHDTDPSLALTRAIASTPGNHTNAHTATITLEQNLLAKNDLLAAQNRGWFRGRNILALNLVSSPGAGKTTLLTQTIWNLQQEIPVSVIEGDQCTSNDAQRIRETGCPVVQINTGTGCHLDAAMVERGLQTLSPPLNSIVMIENVGNLVCPALFDLGEHAKVIVLSVTEGEDKPIKYPHMFQASQVMILNKIDLLPYVSFDVDLCLSYAHQVNPNLQVFQLSATTGAGLQDWYAWLRTSFSSLEEIDKTPVSC